MFLTLFKNKFNLRLRNFFKLLYSGGIMMIKSKFKIILIFAFIFSILLVSPVFAEDGNNQTGSFDSIQTLIDDANSGDSIYLDDITYASNGSCISVNKDVTIYGSPSKNTVLDGDGKSGIFFVNKNVNLNIIDLTLTNGYSTGEGGAIRNYGNLVIHNSTISDTHSNRGGIHCYENSYLTAYNSLFERNTAVSGAAIENNNAKGSVNIINSTFIENNCQEGGAIYNIWGECFVYNSIFRNNSAERGGAIYNNRGLLKVYSTQVIFNHCNDLGAGIKSWGICEVYDSLIANNTNTLLQGGGFYVSEFSLLIHNCTVENNSAVLGGGVYVEAKAELTVENSQIINNIASRGGGIDINQGSISLDNSTVSNNIAETYGGGIYFSFLPSELKNARINNNVAKYGGGIFNDGVNVKISDSEINYNSASDGGAGYNNGILVLDNVDLNFNNANNGGAIYNKEALTIKNSKMNNNKASIYGGTIYNSADLDVDNLQANYNEAKFGGVIYTTDDVNVFNSKFNNNKASEAGVIYSVKQLIIDNCEFTNNQITRKGGVISANGGNVQIDNCLFKLNTGADEGGCIFNYDSKMVINNSKFQSNEAKSYGAAIDSSGNLTIYNSLFDDNQAYGAGAIDNGGELKIINSNFVNNKATVNGGAIDNKGNMNVVGSVFENNVAGENGGAIIARRNTTVSHSIFYKNNDSTGYAVFNNTWDEISFSNNWWGSNNPNFEKLFNFNISDDFSWIVMKFENLTPFKQTIDISISFNEITNNNKSISKLNDTGSLPVFKVSLSNGDQLFVTNGSVSKTVVISSASSISAQAYDQIITLKNSAVTVKRIIDNKNVVVDYNGKATFKVRVIGKDGKPVGKGVSITMKVGKTSYKVKTDSRGYASKTFGFTPGKYTVTTTYSGYSVKNTITIKNVLKASSTSKKKAKTIKYSVSLKTSKGKAISGKKITFKIKGKTYSAKTNKNGIATVSFKNLKVGKYTVSVKYLNYQTKITLRVKR